MNVPEHLRNLSVWRGLPVPYINRWGYEEREIDWGIRYDRNLGEVAAYMANQLGAPPDFRHQCIQRQRECVLLGRCQVCFRAVDWPDRRLVVSSVSVEMVEVQGRQVAVVTEPWLCPDCCKFATAVCPALIRRGRWIEGRYEAATKANPVAMWAKILLLNVAVQTGGKR